MIYDHIKNIERYLKMHPGLAEGLRFLQSAVADLAVGRHELGGGNYANVESYQTAKTNPAGYESHKKFIDIQYLLAGEENVLVSDVKDLQCSSPYDAGRDAAFYHHDPKAIGEFTIGNGYFLVLFPEDAHEPKLCAHEPEEVKKVVVKIEID